MNRRHLLTAAGIALAAVLLAGKVQYLLDNPTVWPPDDFIEYWAAARLALDGQNPYDPALILPIQLSAGRDTDQAVIMWNPPWSYAAVLPFGLLPAREAQLLWLFVNLAAVCLCGDRLWLLFGGGRDRRWAGWVIALGFVPTLFVLQSGQISVLPLLGAVLFLEFERRGWPFLAGAATVLLAIKPHLAYLVWAAILCDSIARRRVAMIAGGITAGIASTLAALAVDPQLLSQYADAMAHRPPSQWLSPTIGSLLRLAFGEELFRLQFVPVILGVAWFAWYWRRSGANWNWTEQLPLLLLVSFITAPYGAWPFDLPMLLPAIFAMVLAKPAMPARARIVLPALIAVNLACLLMNLLQIVSFWFIWVAPVLLMLHVIAVAPRVAPAAELVPSPSPTAV